MKTIRIVEPTDARAVAQIYAPVVAGTAISFETKVPAERDMEDRIAAALAFAPWLVCVDGERVEGYAYASQHRERAAYRWCVDVSVYPERPTHIGCCRRRFLYQRRTPIHEPGATLAFGTRSDRSRGCRRRDGRRLSRAYALGPLPDRHPPLMPTNPASAPRTALRMQRL
jgi:hypothetical protein